MLDWGDVPGWISAIATLVGVSLAGVALNSWREQLKGTSKHSAAQEISVAARMVKYAFYDARSPMYWAGEFPAGYHDNPSKDRTNAEEALARQHIYRTRWRETLWPQIFALAKLRPLAGVTLGDDVADAAEELARKARDLDSMFAEHVQQLRDGPELVKRYSDQKWVQRVKTSVTVSARRDDVFSLEFEAALAKLLRLLEAHLK